MRLSRTLIPIIASALALTACGPKGGKPKQSVQSVAYEVARLQTVTRTVSLIGTVQGDRQATAMPKIAGRVMEIARPEGSVVAEGDPIVYVQNDVPGMDYKPGPVTAPVAGVVGKIYVEIGQSVAPGMPIATVADYSTRVRIKAAVSDADLRFVRTGAQARLAFSAYPDTAFAARVVRVAPVLDQMSRTATVELVADNPGRRLVPGMACSVTLVLEERADVVALPRTALFTNGLQRVAVLDGSTARFREVQVGLVGDDLIEVVAGVAEGDKVITTGKERIADGSEVRTVQEAGK